MRAGRVGPSGAGESELRAVVRGSAGLTVLTGGQTGVDTYAAAAALQAGLPVHLVFPRGLRQEDGRLTVARRRQVTGAAVHELRSASFRYRTWTCAYLADAVLLLDPAGGAGCRETARAAAALGRPLLEPAPGEADAVQVEVWLAANHTRVLMIAGCRASQLASKEAGRGVRADVAAVVAGAAAWRGRLLGG